MKELFFSETSRKRRFSVSKILLASMSRPSHAYLLQLVKLRNRHRLAEIRSARYMDRLGSSYTFLYTDNGHRRATEQACRDSFCWCW